MKFFSLAALATAVCAAPTAQKSFKFHVKTDIPRIVNSEISILNQDNVYKLTTTEEGGGSTFNYDSGKQLIWFEPLGDLVYFGPGEDSLAVFGPSVDPYKVTLEDDGTILTGQPFWVCTNDNSAYFLHNAEKKPEGKCLEVTVSSK